MVKYTNNYKVFKFLTKDTKVAKNLMKKLLVTNEEDIKEISKSEEDKIILMKFDVKEEKVNIEQHSYIHQRFNIITIESSEV